MKDRRWKVQLLRMQGKVKGIKYEVQEMKGAVIKNAR